MIPANDLITNIQEIDVPEAEYHKIDRLSCSKLKSCRRSIKHSTFPVKKTANMRLGSAAHAAILEPDKFEKEYAVFDGRFSGNAYDDICGKYGKDFVIKPQEREKALMIKESVSRRRCLKPILSGDIKIEKTYLFDFLGVPFKARADLINLNERAALDFKTTKDASDDQIPYIIRKFSYHWQAYIYTQVLAAFGTPIDDFIFPFVENDSPFEVNCKILDEQTLQVAEDEIIPLVELYGRYLETGEMTGYPDEVRKIGLPRGGMIVDVEEDLEPLFD